MNIPPSQALLLFRVGPIRCCASAAAVVTILPSPPVTRLPGSNTPGIFTHAGRLVITRDLSCLFGITESSASAAQRVIVTRLPPGQVGFFVDEIIEVREMPRTGFSPLPALIPREIFNQLLVLNHQLYLHTDFERLAALRGQGYLRRYLRQLHAQTPAVTATVPAATTPVRSALSTSTVSAPLAPPPPAASVAATQKPASPLTPLPAAAPRRAATSSIPRDKPAPSPRTPPSAITPSPPRRATAPRPPALCNPLQMTTPASTPAVRAKKGGRLLSIAVSLATALCLGVWWYDDGPAVSRPFALNLTNPTTDPLVTEDTSARLTLGPSPQPVLPGMPDPSAGGYQAAISPDNHGITIVLNSPREDPVFMQNHPVPGPTEIQHLVVKGDTLWQIARQYVNNPYRYPELARLSQIKNPDLIYPGDRVRIIKNPSP
ncbi:MAG: chemotaxis protein CheW [Gammaproteobacteria bacterium]|nr:chemotaxis protein CheW [Gammaproteobacteria bacterium]